MKVCERLTHSSSQRLESILQVVGVLLDSVPILQLPFWANPHAEPPHSLVHENIPPGKECRTLNRITVLTVGRYQLGNVVAEKLRRRRLTPVQTWPITCADVSRQGL